MESRNPQSIKSLSNLLFEMANITPNIHKLGIDLKFHVEQPGDKLPPHFANTKVFRGDFKTTDKLFKVTIPDLKISGSTNWLNAKDLKKVLKFIEINKKGFIALFKDQGLSPDEIEWKSP